MITAFLLGIMGSLHCAGMCGPLVLMTPVVGNTNSSFLASRFIYHLGRIVTYALIGVFFGLIGESIVLAGFQRWLSLIVGLAMLTGLFAAVPLKKRFARGPIAIKAVFGRLLRERSYRSNFLLGATNGLLPCGLVYLAATASIVAGSILQSAIYMMLFGIGTLPILLGFSLAARRLDLLKLRPFQKLVPATVALTALLLIVRAQPFSLLHSDSPKPVCPACSDLNKK